MKIRNRKHKAGRAQTTISLSTELLQKIQLAADANFRSRSRQIEVFLANAVSHSITAEGFSSSVQVVAE